MKAVCEDIRHWAVDEGRDIDEPTTLRRSIRWQAYEPLP
jgi:hypothetical protein